MLWWGWIDGMKTDEKLSFLLNKMHFTIIFVSYSKQGFWDVFLRQFQLSKKQMLNIFE